MSARWPLDATTARLLRVSETRLMRAAGAEFDLLESAGWRGLVFRRSATADGIAAGVPSSWTRGLDQLLGRWEDSAGHRVLKRSDSGTVFQMELEGAAAPLSILCKAGRRRGFLQRAATVWGGPKEFREFWAGHRLRQAGIRTPLPLACLWRRSGLEIRARLVTMFLPDARGLDHTLTTLCARRQGRLLSPRGPQAISALSRDLGTLIGRLSQLGVYHRDLKASNIMVAAAGNELVPWLIDLDGLQPDRRPFGPGCVRSLARLSSSIADTARIPRTCHLRTLRAALGAGGDMATWKAWWHRVRAEGRARAGRPRGHKLADYQ